MCVTVSEHFPKLFVSPVQSPEAPGVLKAPLSGHLAVVSVPLVKKRRKKRTLNLKGQDTYCL